MKPLKKIEEKLDNITQFGQERYLGKCIGSIQLVFSYIIFEIVLSDVMLSIFLAVVWCGGVGILTYFFSKYTETGKIRIAKLEEFFEKI